tara:strand:+ start:45 stop:2360 length:2316 start_codon:yes stop_codon:yes gene_type:complete
MNRDIKKYQGGGLLSGPIQSREYVPLPYEKAFEMQRLNEADRNVKEKEMLGVYKGFYDSAMQAPPGMQDEAMAEMQPYLDRIDQGLAEVGGDPLKYRGGMDVMKSFYGDMASGRVGSLQQVGAQYSAAKKEQDKLNELFMKGKGGVPENISQRALQLALSNAQKEYDAGRPARFNMPNLVPATDILKDTRAHLTNKKANGFTDKNGNKIESLTLEQLVPYAENFITQDPGAYGTIRQEVDLGMATGAYQVPADVSDLLKNKEYAQLYKDVIQRQGGLANPEQAESVATAAVYRQSLIDNAIKNNAITASQVFEQNVQEFDKNKDSKRKNPTDLYAASDALNLDLGPKTVDRTETVRGLNASLLEAQTLLSQYNEEGTNQAAINSSQEQVQFLETELKNAKKSIKTRAKDVITSAYNAVGNKDEYENITSGLSGDEKKIANLLAVAGTGATLNIFSGGAATMGTGASSTQVSPQDQLKNLKAIVTEYKDVFGLEPDAITLKNATKINNVARELQKDVKKIETAKEYEKTVIALSPFNIGEGVDVIEELSSSITDKFNKGLTQYVDPGTGEDFNAILANDEGYRNRVAASAGKQEIPGMTLTPTATFIDGKQVFAASYYTKGGFTDKTGIETRYVVGANRNVPTEGENIKSIARTLLESTNPANQQLGQNMMSDYFYGGALQATEIEYAESNDVSDFKGSNMQQVYSKEMPYIDEPVQGIDGVGSVRRVEVGPGIYDYYMLNEDNEAYIKKDKSGYITARSLMEIGRMFDAEF